MDNSNNTTRCDDDHHEEDGSCQTLGTPQFRKTHFKRIEEEGIVYLDAYGAPLYSEVQLARYLESLSKNVYGNPHSQSTSSQLTSGEICHVRAQVLELFKTNTSKHSVIFTSGATAALKLLGESFPFTPSSTFLAQKDSHNSLLGISEYARQRGARVILLPSVMEYKQEYAETNRAKNLVVIPAECNFTGQKAPISDIISSIRGFSVSDGEPSREKSWYIGLDASAMVSHSVLDLTALEGIDFVTLSFYKIFGFPTGLGALIVRNGIVSSLSKSRTTF